MILGYSTNAFTRFDLPEAFARIAALGFGGVEIMCDRPHLYPPDYGPERLAEVQAALDKNGLKPTNLNGFTLFAVGDTYLPSWIEPEAERREIRVRHTLECLKAAHALGCANISVPPGGPLAGISRSRATALFREGLERVLPEAERLGVRVLIEPEPELFIERTAEFKAFIGPIDSPAAGLNFDIGHFFCVGENPADAFEELFAWVGHVHLEDIAPNRRHHHLIAGRGAIDFEQVLGTMQRMDYGGDITLELYPYTDDPESAGRESLDHLRPIFEACGLPLQPPRPAPDTASGHGKVRT